MELGTEIWPVGTRDISFYAADAVVIIALTSLRPRNFACGILLYVAAFRTMAQAYITFMGHNNEATIVYLCMDRLLFAAIATAAVGMLYRRHRELALLVGVCYIEFVSYYTWHEERTDWFRLVDSSAAVGLLFLAALLAGKWHYACAALCLGGNLMVAFFVVSRSTGSADPLLCRATTDLSLVIASGCLGNYGIATAEAIDDEEDEELGGAVIAPTAETVVGITCRPLTSAGIDERLRAATPTAPTAPSVQL